MKPGDDGQLYGRVLDSCCWYIKVKEKAVFALVSLVPSILDMAIPSR